MEVDQIIQEINDRDVWVEPFYGASPNQNLYVSLLVRMSEGLAERLRIVSPRSDLYGFAGRVGGFSDGRTPPEQVFDLFYNLAMTAARICCGVQTFSWASQSIERDSYVYYDVEQHATRLMQTELSLATFPRRINEAAEEAERLLGFRPVFCTPLLNHYQNEMDQLRLLTFLEQAYFPPNLIRPFVVLESFTNKPVFADAVVLSKVEYETLRKKLGAKNGKAKGFSGSGERDYGGRHGDGSRHGLLVEEYN